VLGREDMLADPRFATEASRKENNTALRDELTAMLADKSAADVEAKLAAAEVPVAMVRNIQEITGHAQFDTRALFVKTKLPGTGEELTLMGTGFELEDKLTDPGTIPLVGEHTDEVLASLGYDKDKIAAMREKGIV
jgi:crotonobetainyl-CoA:carnitine CoA-transferase CaiB-like acyl-CoA transferase